MHITFSIKAVCADVAKANQEKLFDSSELKIYIDLVYWAMEALDIYTISIATNNQQRTSNQGPRTKEEKEVLEHFSGIVITYISNFLDIFNTLISFSVSNDASSKFSRSFRNYY